MSIIEGTAISNDITVNQILFIFNFVLEECINDRLRLNEHIFNMTICLKY